MKLVLIFASIGMAVVVAWLVGKAIESTSDHMDDSWRWGCRDGEK